MELMVVIAIILVLATMVISGVGWYKRKVAEEKTEVLIKGVARALDEYKSDYGFYPEGNGKKGSTTQVYAALFGDEELEPQLDNTGKVTGIVFKNGATPDGKINEGLTTYLSLLDPDLTGNKLNVDTQDYVIVDAWFEQLRYRHSVTDSVSDMLDNEILNPDFDLWSMGVDGAGRGSSSNTEKTRKDDIKNW